MVHEAYHFINAIVNDTSVSPLGATFQDGYKCNVVLEAMAESAKTGRETQVNFVESVRASKTNDCYLALGSVNAKLFFTGPESDYNFTEPVATWGIQLWFSIPTSSCSGSIG